MTAFLHFDKLLQLPLILGHELGTASYRAQIEAFAREHRLRTVRYLMQRVADGQHPFTAAATRA